MDKCSSLLSPFVNYDKDELWIETLMFNVCEKVLFGNYSVIIFVFLFPPMLYNFFAIKFAPLTDSQTYLLAMANLA